MARPYSELKHKKDVRLAGERLIMENFISELASMYLPTEDGPEASELAFLRIIMQARQIEREYIETAPNPHRGSSADMFFSDEIEAVGLWPDAPEVDELCDENKRRW
jgi:hypothetical protein